MKSHKQAQYSDNTVDMLVGTREISQGTTLDNFWVALFILDMRAFVLS